jgi:dihydropteroate synthase
MIKIMGIVNVTPDSFFDGGVYNAPDLAIAHGIRLLKEGADILDIGGESTRPGASALSPSLECERVLPVLEALREAAANYGAKLSVDTRNATTMQAALAAGADMVNDISALMHDPDSLAVVAGASCDIVLMHMQGRPETMQENPVYEDVVEEVSTYLQQRIEATLSAGIAKNRLIADPGIGFGKTLEHNLALLKALPRFKALGVRLLVGASRKGMIGKLSRGEPAPERLGGSLAIALHAAACEVDIIRVHDVKETVQAFKVASALK